MFNYHLYEKLQKEQREEEENKIREGKDKEKRKSKKISKLLELNSMLAGNYDKRIQNFIFKMANKPIKIKDYTHAIENPRMQLMRETDDKIQGRKGFIFKGFVTEKERIKQYLEDRKKYIDDDDFSDKKDCSFNSKKKNDQLVTYMQPKMRFKPRTDLERIYEAINDYSYGRVSKNPVTRQLKLLNLNYMKIFKNQSEEDEKGDQAPQKDKNQADLGAADDDDNNNNYGSNYNEELDFTSKDKLGVRKRRIDNSGAKALMKEYHIKTHFKAASIVASKNISSYSLEKKDLNKQNLNKFQNSSASSNQNSFHFNKTQAPFYNNKNIDNKDDGTFNKTNSKFQNNSGLNSTTQGFNLYQKFSKKFALDEDNLDIIESNPLLYNLNMNPLRKANEEETVDPSKLDYLKNLAENKKEEHMVQKKIKGVKFLANLKDGKRKVNGIISDSPAKFFANMPKDEDENDNKRGNF
jgi:hypothetical protein